MPATNEIRAGISWCQGDQKMDTVTGVLLLTKETSLDSLSPKLSVPNNFRFHASELRYLANRS